MRIYPAEKQLGIHQKILANTIVTATAPVRPTRQANRIAATTDSHLRFTQSEAGRAYAAYNDLYYVDTILVSSGMNKNDDCFGSQEVWRARHTPVDKPTNIGHIPDLVCGHMTRSWVLTAGKRKIIQNNKAENDLPSILHLACSAVIYRDLGSMYQNEINTLILKIEADEMAVSMEAHFDEFDYALLNEATGTVKVVARNEETAWMSGLLRWLGGEGVYTVKEDGNIKEYYRIGRYLKGITFTGKGFVTNPANPDSIILTKSFEPMSAAEVNKAAAFNKSVANKITIGSLTKKETKTMSEINPIEYAGVLARANNADKLEKENDKLQAKVEGLTNELAQAKTSIGEFQLSEKHYKQLMEAGEKEAEKDKKEKAELQAMLEAAKKEKEEDEKDKKEKAEKIEALEKELAALKTAQETAARQALLLEGGIDAKEAEAFVKTYANFNDEQFKLVASTHIAGNKAKAAIEEAIKSGKVTADVFETMQSVDAKKSEDDKDKEKEDDKDKEKSKNSIFASMGKFVTQSRNAG